MGAIKDFSATGVGVTSKAILDEDLRRSPSTDGHLRESNRPNIVHLPESGIEWLLQAGKKGADFAEHVGFI